MKSRYSAELLIFIVILTGLLLFLFPVSAEDVTYFKPITQINLGVKELELSSGESYTFQMSYSPKETPAEFISWLTDDSIIQINPGTCSITAVSSGTARLLVESNSGFTWDYCDITVKDAGGKSAAAEKIAGSEVINLAPLDRTKIKAKTVQNYISFIENNSFTNNKLDEILNRSFNVTAVVNKGSVDSQRELAASFGMEKTLPLPDFDSISLRGTISQILSYIRGNSDLIKIIEFAPMTFDDPVVVTDPGKKIEKTINLGTHVETLTSVSVAHNAGIKGSGSAVAIIDTGLNPNHEQFAGRVVAEACFALSNTTYQAVCTYGTTGTGASKPSLTDHAAWHNHGSHVTGIAAGLGGIAPEADIISINVSVEDCSGSQCVQALYWDPWEVAEYLKGLQDDYRDSNSPLIVSVNMSLGSNESNADFCDEKYDDFLDTFDLLIQNDMIPVVATGNEGHDDGISTPACISNAFRVGALSESADPTIADFSNHNGMVDILAPGTEISSAIYVYENDNSIRYVSCDDGVGGSSNCYGISQGTSMATPMVSGAFALLKQVYPTMSVSELESELKRMSDITADTKENGTHFSFTTPTLDFTNIIQRPVATSLTIKNENGEPITGLSITLESRLFQIYAAASPEGALQKFNWESSDISIATVDNSGLVTFRKEGTVTITVSTKDSSLLSAFVTLTLPKGANVAACGTNVKYTIDGNTITFSQINNNEDAFWGDNCGYAFKDDPSITNLTIDNPIIVTDAVKMFMDSLFIQEMDLTNLDVSNVTDLTGTFAGCESLVSLNVSNWETGNVTDMKGLFDHCMALENLDVSKWDTSKVTSFLGTFAGCNSLTSLDIRDWNTSNVTDTNGMFNGCNSLTSLDLSKWNVSNVTDMGWMFIGCSALTSLDLSGWDTSSATDMNSMFYGCQSLKVIDVSTWDTSNVWHMGSMFYNCSSLRSLDLGRWNTSNVTNMTYMFSYCFMLKNLDISGWDTTRVKANLFGDPPFYEVNQDYLFDDCYSLTSINIGRNTLKKADFFATSPYYDTTWYYAASGPDAGDPIAVGSARLNKTLFTEYNYNTMAGIWSADVDYPVTYNKMILPSGLKTIEASAFEGISSVDEVVIPSGLTTIGSRAFACSSLSLVRIPDSVISISDDAFTNNANMMLSCQSNSSVGAAFARKNNIPYRIEP